MFIIKGKAPTQKIRIFAYKSDESVRLSFKSKTDNVYCFISKQFTKVVIQVIQKIIQNDKIMFVSGSKIASLIKNWTSVKVISSHIKNTSQTNLTAFSGKIFLF